jgi:hypothetical protein
MIVLLCEDRRLINPLIEIFWLHTLVYKSCPVQKINHALCLVPLVDTYKT